MYDHACSVVVLVFLFFFRFSMGRAKVLCFSFFFTIVAVLMCRCAVDHGVVGWPTLPVSLSLSLSCRLELPCSLSTGSLQLGYSLFNY